MYNEWYRNAEMFNHSFVYEKNDNILLIKELINLYNVCELFWHYIISISYQTVLFQHQISKLLYH